nr:protein MAIN-LIKE 1-like [Arachis hypogaea]
MLEWRREYRERKKWDRKVSRVILVADDDDDEMNDPSLAPPLHVASPVEDKDVDGEDSDEEYVAEDDKKEEFVPETPDRAINSVSSVLSSSNSDLISSPPITSMWRQHDMLLDERIMSYLQMAGLAHLARLHNHWFRLDEPLVSALIERWRLETHTFHMLFEECTIMLQDVAYQLGLSIDGDYVSGCLMDFERYIDDGRPAWDWLVELLGVLSSVDCINKFTIKCTRMQKTISDLPQDADKETVKRYARTYIMMLLSTQLFGDKSSTCMHIRWLSYVARLEDMGRYSWGSATLSWLYWCLCHVANRNVVKLAGSFQLL